MVAVLAITACYAPAPSVGAPCGPGELCPAGLTCSSQNTCVGGEELDASSPDSPSDSDVPPTDVPRKRWNLIATSGKVGTTLDIDPTQQGNTILVGIETSSLGSVTGVTDDAGNEYVAIPSSRASNIGRSAVELWLAQDSKAGAVKITAAGTALGALVAWEVANLAPDPVVDVGTLDTQAVSTTPTGVEMTLTERGQFMVSILIVANAATIVPGDFTNDETTFGNGWAHLTDDDAAPGAYQATWNQAMAGTSCATSVVLRVAD